MAVQTTKTNKPFNPRGNDQSPLAFNRAKLYSGKALDFDGANDYVDLDGFTMAGNIATISFHLKADDWDVNSFIFAAGTPEIVLGSTTGGNNLSFYDSSSWQTFGAISDTTSTNFFSIVFNGTSAIAYMNGVKFGNTLTITPINISSVTGVKLMSKYTGDAFFFNGQISGTKIFNTALTAAQVADLYNNPEKVVPTGVDNTALKLFLPMQEGAGTTAYDGSGNGNHGTISGATYTHGIGAPVSQTAVINWNKGTNILPYSEDLDNGSSAFTPRGFVQNSSTETSPIGTSDAYKYTENDTNSNPALYYTGDFSDGNSQTFKVYLKADAATTFSISTQGNTEGPDINVTTEWAQYEVTQSVNTGTGPHIGGFLSITQGSGIVLYVWHPQMSYGDSVYVPTLATAQTSEVLLPQGLTTGRDITGVNLFENVRKQGALNLDGNSWAEVHDNASLDITDAITLEAWVWYLEGDSDWAAVSKYQTGATAFMMYIQPARRVNLFANGSSRASSNTDVLTNNAWNHIAITYDKANVRIYINGSEDNSAAYTAALTTTSKVVEIGRYWASNTYATDGSKIAQPRIYNRALTAEEVARNYNNAKSIYTNS
jgi:hypothetical protein